MMRAVLGRSLENLFIRSWVDLYGASIKQKWGDTQGRFVASFTVSDEMIDAFLSYSADKGVVIGDRSTSAEESVTFTESDLDADRGQLYALLKGRLATRLYDRSAWYPVWRKVDHVLIESQKLWDPADDLASQYALAR